jgi:hypothetical protein
MMSSSWRALRVLEWTGAWTSPCISAVLLQKSVVDPCKLALQRRQVRSSARLSGASNEGKRVGRSFSARALFPNAPSHRHNPAFVSRTVTRFTLRCRPQSLAPSCLPTSLARPSIPITTSASRLPERPPLRSLAADAIGNPHAAQHIRTSDHDNGLAIQPWQAVHPNALQLRKGARPGQPGLITAAALQQQVMGQEVQPTRLGQPPPAPTTVFRASHHTRRNHRVAGFDAGHGHLQAAQVEPPAPTWR